MSLESIPPEELFRRCTAMQDAQAWGEFHRRYHRDIASVVYRLLSKSGSANPADVEELIQSVYLHLLVRAEKILAGFRKGAPESDHGFLKVVAQRCALDQLRRSNKRGYTLFPIDDQETNSMHFDGQAAAERQALIGLVSDRVDALATERDRQIFWLHYRSGLTAVEIAGHSSFGLTAKGVESVLMRLMSELRECFGENRGGEGKKS